MKQLISILAFFLLCYSCKNADPIEAKVNFTLDKPVKIYKKNLQKNDVVSICIPIEIYVKNNSFKDIRLTMVYSGETQHDGNIGSGSFFIRENQKHKFSPFGSYKEQVYASYAIKTDQKMKEELKDYLFDAQNKNSDWVETPYSISEFKTKHPYVYESLFEKQEYVILNFGIPSDNRFIRKGVPVKY